MMKTIPEIVNYETDSLYVICQFEIERLRGLIAELNKADKLCSYIGETIVAEFGFKGNLKEVRKQLHDLRNRYIKQGLTALDRPILVANDKLDATNKKDDFYREEFNKKLTTNYEEAMEISRKIQERTKSLHEKRECLCYNNYEISSN
ncbi:MAG: hypothetical protein ACTSW1_07475 [Candidatus Hodarchaeales archaeon]